MQTAAVSAPPSGDLDHLRGLLAGPTFAPLTDAIRLSIGPTPDGAPFFVPQPRALVVARSTLGSPAASVQLRHGLELAWLLGEGAAPPLAGLLAARTAALLLALEPPAIRAQWQDDPWLCDLPPLGADCPDARQLAAAWRRLAALQAAPAAPFTQAVAERAASCWLLAGPDEHLLTTGGDSRLRLDPATGLNRYGCAPRPRPGAISFGSCTASSVSERGYAAAEACRRRLLRRALAAGPVAALAEESQAIRAEILDWYGAGELAEAILAPSGTDASLLLSGLLSGRPTGAGPAPRVTSILVSPTETGTGIPAAVSGQHFAECTARGLAVAKGAAVAGFPAGMRLESIALRGADGSPLPAAAVGRRFAAAVERAAASGRAVLHMVDSTKTGLSAPGLRGARDLARRYGGGLDIAVDACQARVQPARLRRWLTSGWPVLLTGSKFFGGPPFSGVILFPRERLARILANGAPPAGLADYLGGDFPRLLGPADNPGLALRWAAALAEMRAFALTPPAEAAALLCRLGTGLEGLLDGNRHLHLVPGARARGPEWGDQPSIYTIMVRDPADPARWLSPAALGGLYAMMNRDLGERLPAGAARSLGRQAHHIGQPVLIGQSPAGPIGGLRIAFGARHLQPLAEAGRPEPVFARTIGELEACVGKLAVLLDQLPELAGSA